MDERSSPVTGRTGDPDDPEVQADQAAEPRWCVVANVVGARLRAGEQVSGTKHFSGGTKVWFHSAYWGMGGESVTVVGRSRSGRWIRVVLDARVLESWRARVEYSPSVLRHLVDDEVAGDESIARDVVRALSTVSADRRVRLTECTPEECHGRLAAVREPILVAHGPHRGADDRAYVLHDGARTVAGMLLRVYPYPGVQNAGTLTWSSVWVVKDRRETLAELVSLVQRRHHGFELLWVESLARQLRDDATDEDPPA